MSSVESPIRPLALCLQPACVKHRWIRTSNASHIYERPERIRAVLLGAAAAVSRLEEGSNLEGQSKLDGGAGHNEQQEEEERRKREETPDVSDMLGNLNLSGSTPQRPIRTGNEAAPTTTSPYLYIPPPESTQPASDTSQPRLLQTHPALQVVHSSLADHNHSLLDLALTSQGQSRSTTSPSSLFPQSPYLKQLSTWALEAPEKIKRGECEIPSRYYPVPSISVGQGEDGTTGMAADMGIELNQNDLYLAPGSVEAIEGCVKTVCQAMDLVCTRDAARDPSADSAISASAGSGSAPISSPGQSPYAGAFCVIRPPGHHCAQDVPSGFCYVNNAAIAAMHGYLQHDQDRAIFIDIDLHHGNGTQSIVMALNEASQADDLLIAGGKPLAPMTPEEMAAGRRKRNWKGFYGSVHDIWSYPCEDGDLDLIKDASVKVAAHGQYIDNIHLEPYDSEDDFYTRIYPKYMALLASAERFVRETEASPDRSTVIISAGFDACEHEYQAMSRHERRVPTSFFARITRDIRAFADKYANGKLVSVLEGGYSDKALTSGALSHVAGFFAERLSQASWWTEENLENLERSTKRKKNGVLLPLDSESRSDAHLSRTRALLEDFERAGVNGAGVKLDMSPVSTPRMTLRERKKTEPWTPTATPRNVGRSKGKTDASSPPDAPSSPVPTPNDNVIEGIVEQLDNMKIKPASATTPQPQPKLRGLDKDSEEVRYSKTLAYMLRHGAEKERLPMRKDGYVRVVDMLNHPKLKNLSWPLLHHLVVTNAKQRFVLFYGHDPSPVRPVYQKKGSGGSSRKGEPKLDPAASELSLISLEAPAAPVYDSESAASGSNASAPIQSTTLGEGGAVVEAEWFIRAAQGHSLPTVTTEHLDPVSNDDEGRSKVGEMVHGTKEELWDVIRETGLSRMTRQHVHLTTAREGAKSGPRANSTLFVYVSLPKLSEREPPIPVYLSSNGVVLTPGDEYGKVPADCFERVIRVRKERIMPDVEDAPSTESKEAGTGEVAAGGTDEGVKSSTSKRGKVKGGVRFWDEVIWEYGQPVDPPRQQARVSMKF